MSVASGGTRRHQIQFKTINFCTYVHRKSCDVDLPTEHELEKFYQALSSSEIKPRTYSGDHVPIF